MNALLSCLSTSKCFNDYALGLGALLAGAAGFKLLLDWGNNWNEIKRRNNLREELKVRYPLSKFDNTYRLIETDFPPGWVYLHDKIKNHRHHIASMLTLIKLGFNRSKVEKISQKEFDIIDEKEEFLTDGERYS